MIRYGNPGLFDREPERLDILSEAVHGLSLSVKDAVSVDFFKGNWGDYRNLVGGRLEGWISNFQNRLELLLESLKPEGTHEKIFSVIAPFFDEHRDIFGSSERLAFQQLIELRPRLHSILEQTTVGGASENLGQMLSDYRSYLAEIREVLMKWNNEGIPDRLFRQHDDLDKMCEKKTQKWSAKNIPDDLDQYPRFIGQAAADPKEQIEDAADSVTAIALAGHQLVTNITISMAAIYPEHWLDGKQLFRRQLERLLDLGRRSRNARQVWSFLDQMIDKDQLNQHPRRNDLMEWWTDKDSRFLKFYVSGFERSKYVEMPVAEMDYAKFLESFGAHFGIAQLKTIEEFSHFLGVTTGAPNVDNGELLKFYWALHLLSLPEGVVLDGIESTGLDVLREVSLAGLLFEETGALRRQGIKRQNLQRFVQAGVGATLRGNLALLSRHRFTERHVIQTTNGEQSFLQYIPLEWGESVIDAADIQGQLDALSEQMQSVKGKDSTTYQRLKRRERRLRLALRSNEDKWRKQLFHLNRDIARWQGDEELDRDELDLLQQRKQTLQTKLQKSLNGFSTQAMLILDSVGIAYDSVTNQDVVAAIWSMFDRVNEVAQRGLLQVLGEIPHRWNVVLRTKQPLASLEPVRIGSGFFLEKSTAKEVFELSTKKTNCYLYALPIKTSSVQKQFLEKFLWGDKTGTLTEKMLGSSVIVEQEKVVQWRNGKPTIANGAFSMYWAVPFQLEKEKSDDDVRGKRLLEGTCIEITNSEGKSQKQYRLEKNILGIDLGEYGFGWAVFDPVAEKFVKSGFQSIPLLQKMREGAASWKDTQASGIFSRPTTYLAEIREQAAGQTRNQIHRLALRYHAIPVYEDSVDGFEEGGQRISKLYKTLKTADVIGGESNDADKAVRKHFWGIDYAQIGGVIGAAKTSQTCRACGRCATSEVRSLTGERVEVLGGLVVGTNTPGVRSALSDGNHEKRVVESQVKAAQRGPGEDGGQSQFICQICSHKAHADRQAAQNIALKYYFKLIVTEEEKSRYKDEKSGQLSTLKLFLDKSKDKQWCGILGQ